MTKKLWASTADKNDDGDSDTESYKILIVTSDKDISHPAEPDFKSEWCKNLYPFPTPINFMTSLSLQRLLNLPPQEEY